MPQMLILAHNQKIYREMGKLVANPKNYELEELYTNYENLLLESLKFKTTIRKM